MPGSIIWRFAVSGADQARADLASLGPAGAEAAAQLDASWGKTNATTAASIEQFRQLRDAAAEAAASANSANTNVQTRVNQTTGVGAAARPASSSASVFAAQFADYDRQAAALRAKIDPAAAAQMKMNAAIAAAGTLLKTGTITEAEHAAAVTLAEKAYKDATTAVNAMGHATTGTSGIVREALVIMRELGRGDFSRLAGSATIEAQRLGLLEAILSPTGVAIGVFAAAVIAAAVVEERWVEIQDRVLVSVEGLGAATGITVGRINEIAEAQANAGKISAAAARDIEVAFTDTGRIDPQNLQKAVGIVKDYATFMHEQMPQATAELAKAFADPAKGAEELSSKITGLLTPAELDHIRSLQESGDRSQALAELLGRLSDRVDGTAAHISGLAAVGDTLHRSFDAAADAGGRLMSVLLHVPTADPVVRMGDAIQHLAQLNAMNPVEKTLMSPGDYAKQVKAAKDDIAAAQAELKKSADQTKTAALGTTATDFAAAFNGVDPQAEQIRQKTAQIAELQKGLKDPAVLVASGKTADQTRAAIAVGDRELKQLEERSEHLDKHGAALARDAAAMTANAQAALAAAAAYAQSDAAGGRAEARQKAVTDATRRGIPVGPEIARQENESGAQAALGGEKSAAETRDRTAALKEMDDQVIAGTASYKEAQQAMEDQTKLHALLIAQNEGDAATRAAATKALNDYRAALIATHAEEQRSQIGQALSEHRDKSAELDRQLALAALPKGSRQHDDTAATLQAQAELRQKGVTDFTTPEAQSYISGAVSDAGKSRAVASTTYVTDTLSAQQKATQEIQAQIGLVTKGAVEQASALTLLKQEQDLRDHNVSASSAEGQAILASTQSQIRFNQALADAKANYDELKQTGEGFISTIGGALGNLDQGAGAFGAAWLNAFKQIEQEAIKLAFINPMENQLFGQNLPTFASAAGFASTFNLFGNGGAFTLPQSVSPLGLPNLTPIDPLAGIGSVLPFLGFNAKGTSSWRGGRTWVGEDGPELVDLPAGSAVYNADRSRTMMASSAPAQSNGGNGGGDVHLHNNTGQPMRATRSTGSNGDLMIQLAPLFKEGLKGVSRDGSLYQAFKSMPKTTKDRP